LVQDTVRWRAALDTTVKLRAPGKAGGWEGREGTERGVFVDKLSYY